MLKAIKNNPNIDNIGGFLTIASMLLAFFFANYSNWYHPLISHQVFIFNSGFSLEYVVKDMLMVIFFAYIGMELKQEFHDGSLANKRQVILPFLAAFGGMLVPALLYIAINIKHPENYDGFAIACATDIAFAICLFNFIGKILPTSIKIFLLSIAIFDDLGAIFIIAIFYNNGLDFYILLYSLPIFAALYWLHLKQVTYLPMYIIPVIMLCMIFHYANLHTTLAGFITAFFLPVNDKNSRAYLKPIAKEFHPYIQLFILPLFSFCSTGIVLGAVQIDDLLNPIFIGILIGLFLGKQIGIFIFSYITIKLKLASLPYNSRFLHVYFASIFGGIGFTMSLFISNMAFENIAMQNIAKLAVIFASIICSIFAVFSLKIYKLFSKVA